MKIAIKKLFNIKNKSLRSSQAGFTLLEAIIYLVIVGIVISAVVDFAVTMGNTTAKMSANIDASRNRRFALATINYLIRNADGMLKNVYGDCSNLSVNPPVLALYFNSDGYLPGNCVENGGGVKITVVNNRLKMTCYPNITNNGQYNACSATASSTYFLTGPEVVVTNTNLDFSTSTASTTANSYNTITTHLKVTLPSNDQVSLRASSEATSTADTRNQQSDGLVAFYKFDDASGSSAIDSIGGTSLNCPATSPSPTTALVAGSSGAFDFNNGQYCDINNPEKLNMGSSFSLSAWIKMDSPSAIEHAIINKHAWGASKGYYLMVYSNTGRVIFRVCDTSACTNILDVSGVISNATVYNITVVYDQPNSSGNMYIYQKGVGGISTTTATTWPILVNTDTAYYPKIGNNFEGIIDDLRVYNRALSNSEVWAIQSQGAY